MAIASLNVARLKARDARRIADIRELQIALELYYNSQSVPQYPQASATCDATAAYGLEALIAGGFMHVVPRDPNAVPNCYRYTSNSTPPRTTYHIGAVMEEATNPVLVADKDCDSTDNNPACATGITFGPAGASPAGPFDGRGPSPDANGDDPAVRIYDLVP